MGEILEKDGNKRRGRKASRIDMTPMVDLAFLLLTFFMLTTTFAKPMVMKISMPVETKTTPPPLKESDALTIYLGPHDQVYYLDGLADKPTAKVEKSDFSDAGIRKHILARRKENVAFNRGREKLFVLIKRVLGFGR